MNDNAVCLSPLTINRRHADSSVNIIFGKKISFQELRNMLYDNIRSYDDFYNLFKWIIGEQNMDYINLQEKCTYMYDKNNVLFSFMLCYIEIFNGLYQSNSNDLKLIITCNPVDDFDVYYGSTSDTMNICLNIYIGCTIQLSNLLYEHKYRHSNSDLNMEIISLLLKRFNNPDSNNVDRTKSINNLTDKAYIICANAPFDISDMIISRNMNTYFSIYNNKLSEDIALMTITE